MPPKDGPEIAHRTDELVDVLGVDLEVDRIDVGEALEEHRLAFHHRLGGQRAEIAKTQDGRAVGDHGDQIALGGVVIGGVGILGDLADRHGHARAIGQRQVALGGHRLGGGDFQLAGLAALVELQRLLVGERGASRGLFSVLMDDRPSKRLSMAARLESGGAACSSLVSASALVHVLPISC